VSTLGDRLKGAREARGLSLQDLADSTKISIPTLEALERLDYSRLPGGIFSRAFVRAYASAVGVDSDEAVAEFLEDHARYEREAATKVKGPEITADDQEFLERQQRAVRTLRLGLVIAAILSVGVLAYELWVWWPRAEAVEVETMVAEPPAQPVPAVPPPADGPKAPPATAEPAARPAMVFEFTAAGSCWLHLTADGVVVLNQELKAGDRRRVEASRELRVHAGDAGVLTWTIDGKPAGALGEAGKSARIAITPQTVSRHLR